MEAAGGARARSSWYLVRFCVWSFLLTHVQCERWNGCVDSEAHPGTGMCYKIYPSISGNEAWKNCSPLKNLKDIHLALKDAHHNYDAERFLWMGAIQEAPGSSIYVSYNSARNMTLNRDTGGEKEGCLALDISSSTEMRFERRNCEEVHPMICNTQTKFRAYVHNASAPEACNDSRALSILPLTGCYVGDEDCTQYSVRVRPEWYLFVNLSNVNGSHAVVVLEMNTRSGEYKKEGEPLSGSTNLCYVGRGSFKTIRLQLRQNMTVGGLSLWVGSPGRVDWPPSCVGGAVWKGPAGPEAREALRVTLAHPEGPHVVWCYARDIVTGTIAVSNRVQIPGNDTSDTCPDTNSPMGPPPATTIDPKASCLRCMERAFRSSDCTEDNEECSECTEVQCGPYGLALTEWNSTLSNKGHFEEFRKCAEDRRCAGDVLWQLTEGGDYNGDGVVDCDDRFLRLFSPRRDVDAWDTQEGERFWTCRVNPKRDFVDLPAGNRTARYYCLNNVNKRRRWSDPEYVSKTASYYFPWTESPIATTSDPKREEEETAEELLQFVSFELPPKATISINKTEEIIRNFSRLLDMSENVLRNAQREANISSLPELLESILVRAQPNISFATSNLAVSKKQAIGFQLISDEPLVGLEAFGENPKQIPIASRKDINNSKLEAAVILPKIPKETTVVVVTFAKGSDFTSCQGPANAKSQEINTTVSYKTYFDGSTPIHEPTNIHEHTKIHDPNKTESTDDRSFKSEKHCSQHEDLVRGCINTHVVQVGLLDRNGSYVQLPEGETVDILLRNKIMPMLGQTKTCVYWKPQKGGWASDGCALVEGKDGLDICRCNHLTHFAQLVSEAAVVVGPHKELLNILTACACVTSLLGFSGVILAGILAKKWREKTENKVMLNLAVAMSLFMALFLWASLTPNRPALHSRCPAREKLSLGCRAAGAALHYCVLSSFCWMLVAAVTHYLRFATLTGPEHVSRFVLKWALAGWGAPALPVAVLLAVEPDTYAGRGRDFCYPTGGAFYGAVLAPVLLVLAVNAGLFVQILRRLFPRSCVAGGAPPPPQPWGYNERRALVRRMVVCVAFTFLFGLTWYLGLLAFAVWPAYLFCGVMALQGPAMLLFFVLGEESIRAKILGIKRRLAKDTESTAGFSGSTTSTNTMTMTSQTKSRGRTRKMLPSAGTYVVNGKNRTENTGIEGTRSGIQNKAISNDAK